MYTDDQFQKDNEYLQKRREYNRNLLKNLASRADNMWLVVCVWGYQENNWGKIMEGHPAVDMMYSLITSKIGG